MRLRLITLGRHHLALYLLPLSLSVAQLENLAWASSCDSYLAPQPVYLLTGPPGAGKGTQAAELKAFLNVPHISTGELLRGEMQRESPLGIRVREVMASGGFVDDTLMNELVTERIQLEDCAHGFILDGYPRSVAQAIQLDAILAKNKFKIADVFSLEITLGEAQRRLLRRERFDDTADTIKERFVQYGEQTMPVLDVYDGRGLLRHVSSEGSPEATTEKLIAALQLPKK